MKKRIFSILLSLVMVVGLMPTVAWAESGGGSTETAVAQIQKSNGTYDETKYASFSAAVDAATAGDTVWLLADDNTQQQVTISKSLTVELEGHSLKSTSIQVTGATTAVSINDRVGTGSINKNHYTGFKWQTCTGGSNHTLTRCSATVFVAKGATLTINGVTGTSTSTGTIIYDCAAADLEKAIFVDNSTLVINGGNFVAQSGDGRDALFVNSGNININDGYFCRAISFYTAPSDTYPFVVKKCIIDGGSGGAVWIETSGSMSGVTFSRENQPLEKIRALVQAKSPGSNVTGQTVTGGSYANLVTVNCNIYAATNINSTTLTDGTLYCVGSLTETEPEQITPAAGSKITLAPQIAGGDGTAIAYTWKKDGTVIDGATQSSYEIENYNSATHDGSYEVTATQSGTSVSLYFQIGAASHKHCVCGGSANIGEHTVHSTDTEWTGIASLSEIDKAGNYYLKQNVELDGAWTCSYDGVNLCLNGKTITQKTDAAYVISVGSGKSLTITDCHTGDQVGKITHDTNKAGSGICNSGTLTLWNGSITGNDNSNSSGGYSGGVYNYKGAFTMNGGSITGNGAKEGGGVYNASDASFTMNGGSITGNTVTQSGGGVYHFGQAFNLSGNVNISGNKKVTSSSQTDNNVFLYTSSDTTKTITVESGKTLTNGAKVGITGGLEKTVVTGTTNKTGFFSDAGYSIVPNDDNSGLKLVQKQAVIINLTPTSGYEYNGNAQTPTISVTGDKVAVDALEKTYAGRGETTYSSSAAPTDAGKYKMIVSVPDSNSGYYGSATCDFEITKKDLTVNVTAQDKIYDGNATATLNTATLGGVIEGDKNKVSLDSSGVTAATFENENAGTNKPITLTGNYALTGDAAKNYALTQPTGIKANITKADQTAPEAPTATSVSANSITLNTVSGGQGSVEYKCGDGDWQSSPVFTGLNAATAYNFYVRYTGNGNYNEAVSTGANISTAAASPAQGDGYTIDFAKETIAITDTYEVSDKNDGTGTTISSGSTITPGSNLYIRVKASETVPASAWVALTIPSRPAAPANLTAKHETVDAKNDGEIGGTTEAMEYRKVDSGDWTSCGAGKTIDLEDGTYRVRYKAVTEGDSKNFVSEAAVVTINAGGLLSVTFEENGGAAVQDATNLSYNSLVTLPATSRTGYTFNGWATGTEGSELYPAQTQIQVIDSMNFTAQYTANTYTVKFDSNGGEGTVDNQNFTYDAAQALNENAFTRSGYNFMGWATEADGHVNYYEKQSVKNLTANAGGVVTLYAVWNSKPIYGVAGVVRQAVSGGSDIAAAGVSVRLQQGNTVLFSQITDENGGYSFNVPAGTYNIVAEKDGKKMTQLITITDSDKEAESIVLPYQNVSSELTISEGTPDIVVGGLDEEVVAANHDATSDGNHISLSMTIEQKQDITEDESEGEPVNVELKKEQEGIKAEAGGQKDNLTFFAVNLSKTIKTTSAEGDTSQIETVTSTTKLLEIIIPFETSGKQNFTVYRYHGEGADANVETLTSRPNDDGEFIKVGDSSIIVYAKKFSTYAVGYTTQTKHHNRSHSCSSKCEVCGGCTDSECTYSVCEDKCVLLGMKFTDVDKGVWYSEGVEFVYHRGIMDGVGNNIFDVDGSTSRAMIVTILWRLESKPVVNYAMKFKDVESETWYTEAIRWAASEGVVTGYSDEAFGPNDSVTREQLAAILWRYAKYKGMDVTSNVVEIDKFGDRANVSAYASDAMKWAVGSRIINGTTTTTLSPAGTATRAQAACMMQRFLMGNK